MGGQLQTKDVTLLQRELSTWTTTGRVTHVQGGGMWGNSEAHWVEGRAPEHVEEGGGSDCLALGESNSLR